MEPVLHWFQCSTCDTAWRAAEGTPCWFCGLPATGSRVLVIKESNLNPDSAHGGGTPRKPSYLTIT